MTIDYRAYNDPGVYFDTADAPVVPAPAVTPTVVGLVGDSRRGQEFTEVITLNGVTPVTLQKLGVDITSIIARDTATGVIYAFSTPLDQAPTTTNDLRVLVTAGTDGVKGGANWLDDITTIQREAKAIATETVATPFVTYTTATPHGFVVGDQVTVAGVVDPKYNGRITITAVTSTTFTALAPDQANIPTGSSTGGTGSRVPDGSAVLVTYRYADVNYYAPMSFTDFQSFRDFYGEPWDSSGGTSPPAASPLSLAAMLAFANGASQVIALAVRPDSFSAAGLTQANWQAAIDLMGSMQEVNLVIPLIGNATASGTTATAGSVWMYLRNQLQAWAASEALKIAFIGYDGSAAQDDMTAQSQAEAAVLDSTRMALFAPAYATIITSNGTLAKIGGQYLAAAAAGLFASASPARPITWRQLLGFNSFPKQPIQSVAETAQSKGVAMCRMDTRGGSLTFRVKHGVTTKQNPTVYTREISIQAASDRLHDLLLDTLTNSEVIGGINDDAAPDVVVATISAALDTAVTQDLIQSYGNLAYSVPPDGPTTIIVRFAYVASLPLNVVVVQYAINTSTGEISLEDTNTGEVA